MNLKVCISHFSLPDSHFNSYAELLSGLDNLKDYINRVNYVGSECVIDSNILELDYYGLTLKQQLSNLTNQDPMVYGTLLGKLYQDYFNGKDFEELKDNQDHYKNELEGHCYRAYTPSLNFEEMVSIRNYEGYQSQYELLLGEFPISIDSYLNRAKSRYKNLIFHSGCLEKMESFDGDFCSFTISFTECLTALDGYSPTEEVDSRTNITHIKSLTAYDCSEEGTSRPELKFKFPSTDNNEIELNCEFHLKPSKSNTEGDSRFYQNRIYFGFYPRDLERVIAVASIGPHL